MQSNNTDELRNLKVFQAALNGAKRDGLDEQTLMRFQATWEAELLAREHRKTLEARIDELKKTVMGCEHVIYDDRTTGNAVSVQRLNARIAELQSQLPKKERNV